MLTCSNTRELRLEVSSTIYNTLSTCVPTNYSCSIAIHINLIIFHFSS